MGQHVNTESVSFDTFIIDSYRARRYTLGMVTLDMAAGRFRPRLREMFQSSGKTVYQVAKDGGLDYNTTKRYLREENSDRVTTDALFGILKGLGYTWDQIRDLPLGEVYEIAPDEETPAQ